MNRKKPDKESDAFLLERFLPYRLSLLSNTVSEGISIAYRNEHGLSVTEWRVIAVLGRFSGQTASEIVRRTAMDKVAVSRAVKKLLAKKLVKRSAHEEDRRRQPLMLTERQGQPLYRAVIPKALSYERRLLEALTEPERSSLDRLLQKLQQAAESQNDS
jgi:DNA-binding MarR family transcriptional regulator